MERTPSKRLISSAGELKALAHPLRLDLLEAVTVHRQLTATQAAEIVGESPANCSWHLRQLAKYGYLEEVPGTTGRQRPWRRTSDGMQWLDSDPDPEVEEASRSLTEVFVDREVDRIKRARMRPQVGEWADSAIATQSLTWLTPQEMSTLRDAITELVIAYSGRVTDPEQRPPGSRPVRLLALAARDDSLQSDPNP